MRQLKQSCLPVNVLSFSFQNVDLTSLSHKAERLGDFSLDVYDADPSIEPGTPAKHCNSHPGPMSTPGITLTFECVEQIEGRFLRLSQPANSIQMCELQAFGREKRKLEQCEF